jgi:hypothetical protein
MLKDELFWSPVRLQHFFGGWPLGLDGIVGIIWWQEEHQ